MGHIFGIEMKKAVNRKSFLFAVVAGSVIVLLQTIWYYRNIYSVNNLLYEKACALPYTDGHFGYWYESRLLEGWIGCEPFSPYNQMYFILFPLLAAIPYGASFYNEWRTGYAGQIITRCGRKKYLFSKLAAVFVSGGLAVALPLLLALIISACYLPAIGTDPLSMQGSVANGELWFMLFYEKPVLYALSYILVDFIYGGIYAGMALAASKWFMNRFAVLIFPLLVHGSLYYGISSLFPSLNVYNITYYINPGQTLAENCFGRMLAVTGIVLAGILAVYIGSNRRRDTID